MNLPTQEDMTFAAQAVVGGLVLVGLMANAVSAWQRHLDRKAERAHLAVRYADTKSGETR